MKGKNWRDFEPEKQKRMAEARQRRKKRKRKGGLVKKLKLAVILFIIGYVGFMVYYTFSKPYTIALDAGHGGWDVGAEGIILLPILVPFCFNGGKFVIHFLKPLIQRFPQDA